MVKIDIEKILLLIFFLVILTLGAGVLFDNKIKHDFPFAYGASDAFQHQTRAEWIKDAGNFKYEATYISMGLENVEGRYPPIIYHLSVILSYAAGLEVYDSIYFIVILFAIISTLLVYLIMRNFNKTVALLSLPLAILIFSSPPATGLLWGHWPSLLSQAFLVLLFWTIMRIDLKNSHILIATSLVGMFLTHTSEFVFGIIFLTIFFGVKLLIKQLKFRDVKTMFFAGIIFSIVTFYYIIIFLNTWAVAQHYSFKVQPVWEGNPGFYIAGFGLLLIPIIIGIIFSTKKMKYLHVAFIAALAMLLSGFTNYIGFDVRAFQIRFFWPLYLSIFFGFGLYILLKLIIKKWNFIHITSIFVVLLFIFSGTVNLPAIARTDIQQIPYIPQMNLETSRGIMNPVHWEALQWLSKNTEKEATIYFFYGDIYSQDALLRNSKRTHYQVDPENFISTLQNREIKRNYISELPGDSGGNIMKRESFFEFTNLAETKPREFFFGSKDICQFDYYVVDKVSRQQVLAQYNLLIAQNLLNKTYINLVFENQIVVILKNDNPGDDCIEETNF